MSNIIVPGSKQAPKLTKIQKLYRKIDLIEREVNAAKRLLWVAIQTAGGRIDIPDSVMKQLDKDNELVSFYDSKRKITVMKATTTNVNKIKER